MVSSMARKRRKSAKRKTSSNQFSTEIIGLLLILLGILGFGFGPVGAAIKKVALFLVGELWALVLVLLLFIGVYLLFKRELPTFFSSKLIGFYMLLLVVIVTAHHEFIKLYSPDLIINQTLQGLKARAATITSGASLFSSGLTSIKIGGGMIGGIFAFILAKLFDKIGTTIVLIICSIVSIVLMFDFSLSDLLNKTKDSLFSREETDDEDETEEDDDEEEEEKPVKKESGKSILSLFGKKKENKQEDVVEVTPADVVNEIKEEVHEEAPQVRKAYRLPSITLLDEVPKTGKVNSNDFTKSNKIILERVLRDFDIQGTVVEIHVGPAVTQYEVAVHSGTKLSRVVAIDKEIALALAAKQVSIEAPIPGKQAVGIEVPNTEKEGHTIDHWEDSEGNPVGEPGDNYTPTENITVKSVVGRWLEHSRIYSFGDGDDQKIFIGSGGLLNRNLERRVEAFIEVRTPDTRKQVNEIFRALRDDYEKARFMQPDGTYIRLKPEGKSSSQEALYQYFSGQRVSLEDPEEAASDAEPKPQVQSPAEPVSDVVSAASEPTDTESIQEVDGEPSKKESLFGKIRKLFSR